MRLQQRRIDRQWLADRLARDDLPRWRTVGELSAAVEREVEAMRRHRLRAARDPWRRLGARLDALARTDTVEWMDRDTLAPAERTEMVRALDRFNRVVLSYPRFGLMLRPVINRVHAQTCQPVRIVEIASGAGELMLALDRYAERLGLPVALTGSDIVQTHVDGANARARAEGRSVRFRRLDAFALGEALEPGEADVVLIVQAAHHFPPGAVATMIAQARLAGARDFVLVDGVRGLRTALWLPPLVTLISRGHRKLVHDSWITARKFYADGELELIARLAAPDASRIDVRPRPPGLVSLTVEF